MFCLSAKSAEAFRVFGMGRLVVFTTDLPGAIAAAQG